MRLRVSLALALAVIALIALRRSRRGAVDVWRTGTAWTRQTFSLDDGAPALHAALLNVVARRDRLPSGLSAELTAALTVYDEDTRHVLAPGRSRFVMLSSREPALRYRARLETVRTGRTVELVGTRHRWTWSHEVVFEVPRAFRWPSRADALSLGIWIEHGSRVVASFDLVLRAEPTQRTSLAICMKPLYSEPTQDVVLALSECALHTAACADGLGREHHALLGVDAVHFSARHARFGEHIDEWNRRFGRADTFTHIPPLDPAVAAVWGMMDQCGMSC